jgi:hypothetical protein
MVMGEYEKTYRLLQCKLLADAGFENKDIITAITRFGNLDDDELKKIADPEDAYPSSLLVYTITGAKPAATIASEPMAKIAERIGLATVHWTKDREKLKWYVNGQSEEVYGKLCKQAFEKYIIGFDTTCIDNLLEGVNHNDRCAVGKALGYPEPFDSTYHYKEMDERTKKQVSEGKKFEEPLWYIEHQCRHSMSDEAVKAGTKRKASLLAFGCELMLRGLSEKGTELAELVLNFNTEDKRQYFHCPELPKPELPDLHVLLEKAKQLYLTF